jgi:hypothetical protein
MIIAFLFVVHQHVMGFSAESTKHTFLLFDDGGAIEIRALDEKDSSTIAMIRHHLQLISKRFAGGDFQDPHAVHDRLPDGAATMAKMSGDIDYRYSETPSGGRVRIRTTNSKALEAVHQFLRFQIREHKTGDSSDITRE